MIKLTLSLRTKLHLITALILLGGLILFLFALNQIKRVSEFSTLSSETAQLVTSIETVSQTAQMLTDYQAENLTPSRETSRQLQAKFNQSTAEFSLALQTLTSHYNFVFSKDLEAHRLAADSAIIMLIRDFNTLFALTTKTGSADKQLDEALSKLQLISTATSKQAIRELALSIHIQTEQFRHAPNVIQYEILNGQLLQLRQLLALQQSEQLVPAIEAISQIKAYCNVLLTGHTNYSSAQLIQKTKILESEVNFINAYVLDYLRKASFRAILSIVVIFCCFIVLIIVFIRFINKLIIKPLTALDVFLSQMAKGMLPEPITEKSSAEISEIGAKLNTLSNNLQEKAAYADEISSGKFDAHFEPLSDADFLGISLMELGQSLHKAEMEDRKYKLDEQKRIWVNEGLARFADILRSSNSDIAGLCDHVISHLVNYLKASLGCIYLVNDEGENVIIELISAYAWDRKKFLSRQIQPGEGLIGTCALEKQPIFLTEIPDQYITIRSGLGEAAPNCLLIVPLKLEDQVLGILELASFHKFEEHEREFVEKIAQSIASTVKSVRVNERTAFLLEQSQKYAEEMSEQEEEMRQNMEELKVTQEESARRENEFSEMLRAMHAASPVVELDVNGYIMHFNAIMSNILQVDLLDNIGRPFTEILQIDASDTEYINLWNELKKGNQCSYTHSLKSGDCEVHLLHLFSPVNDLQGKLYKVVDIVQDLTEVMHLKQQSTKDGTSVDQIKAELETLEHHIDHSLYRIELLPGAKISSTNDAVLKAGGYEKNELDGRYFPVMLREKKQGDFEKHWAQVLKGETWAGNISISKADNNEWHMSVYLKPVVVNNEISKVILTGKDYNR